MSSILQTGTISGGIYHYLGQVEGCGYDTPDRPKNFLRAADSVKPGIYLTVITGLGIHNKKYLFAPLARSFWFAVSAKIGFEILPGPELGKILINMSHVRSNQDEVMRLAAGLLIFVRKSQPGYGGRYTVEMTEEDYCVTLNEVKLKIQLI
jgi:hypothetical protein